MKRILALLLACVLCVSLAACKDSEETKPTTEGMAVSTDHYHTVGLKKDGTVVAVGDNEFGQCDVSGWENITSISAGAYYTVGLKKDGTVVSTMITEDRVNCGQTDVQGWTDIVAVCAGANQTVGLKKDGTVVATKLTADHDYLDCGQCDVAGWNLN